MGEVPTEEKEWTERCPNASMNQGGWRKMEYAEDIKTSASQSVQESAECTLSINMNSVLKDRPGFLNDRRNTGMESSQAFPGLPPRLYEAAFRKAQLQSAALGATSSTPVGNIISDRERDRLRGPRMQFLDGNAAASPVGSSVASRSASPSTASSAGQQGTANNGVGIWCENCNTRLVKLKRQALRLMLPNILNGTLSSSRAHEISAILHDKLQVPDSSQKWTDNRCEVCATHLNQLKHEAVAMVQSLERAQSSGDTSSLSNIPALVGSCNLASLQRCLYMHHSHDKSLGHSRQRQGKSPYATPNSMSSPMSAMQLAAQAQQYLEGDSASSKSSSASLSAWSNQQSSALPPHYQASLSSAGSSKSSVMSDVSLNRSTLQQHGPALSSQSRSPPMSSNASTVSNTSAAASFFARAAQKLNLTSKKKKKQTFSADPPNPEPPIFPTNFSDIILKNPPGAPPCLLRSGRRENPGMGKVKVMLRVCPSPHQYEGGSFLSIDPKKKQVTIYDPTFLNNGYVTPAHRRAGIVAPKMFAFDAIFSQDASQTEICAGSMADIVQSVVNGADGCLFCYGHARLGKTYTMIGKDDSPQNLGIIPCAISWLFKIINDRKERSGARFSVRVSAVEVVGKSETLKDLLAEQAMGSANGVGTSPGIYLREDPICGMQLHNQSELRAPTPEKAAFYLDAALAARSQRMADGDCEEDAKNSHMLFTLHIYQYRVDKTGKGGVAGGRSRLHLIDLGSCEKLGKSNGSGSGLSFSALGNVILALVNGAKHVPYKDSKLTQLLRESLGNLSCRTTMIAHVSGAMPFHSETLATVQMASRIHRMRKKKSRYSSTSSSGGESSCDEGRVRRPHIRVLHPRNPPASVPEDAPVTNALTFSDPEYISSSEQSCDTVIYVGSDGAALSDRDLTDNEGPPAMVPIIPRSLTVSKPPSFNRPGGRTFSPEIRRRNSGSRGSDGESGKKGTLSKSAENSPEIRRKNLGPPGEFICAFGPETARKVDANSNGERKILCEFGPQTASPASRHEFGPALPRQSEPGSVTGPRTVLCEFGPETARKVEKVDDGNVLCEFGPETARTADSVSTRTSQNDSPQQTPERKINSPRHRNVEKKSSGIPTPIHTHLQKPKPRDSTSTSPERSQSPRKSNLKSKSSDKQSHIPTPKKSPKKKQAAPPPVRPKPIPPKRTVSQLSEPGYNFAKEERIEPQGEKAESSPVPDSNQATDSISSMKSAVAEQPESAWRRISADEEETISCELPADDVLEQEEEDEEDSLEERAEPVGMSTTNEETAIRGNDKVSDCYFVPISRTEAQEQEQAQERVDTFGHNVSDRPEEGCRSDFDILDNQRPPLNFQGDSTLSLEVNAPDVCDKRIEDEYDINDEEIELCMMKQAQTIQEMSMKDLLSFSLETGNSMEVIGPGNDAEDQLQSPSETPMVDLLTKTLDQMMAGINNSPGFSSSELPLNSDSDLADMIGDSFEHPNMPSASVSQVSYDDDDIESIEPSLIPDEPSSSMYLSVDMFKKQLWDRCIQETVDQIDDLELGDKSDSSDEDHPLRPLSMLSVDSDNTFTTVSTLGPNSRPTSFLSIYSCDKVKDTEPYQSMEAKLFCEQLVAHIVPETAKPEKAMTDTVPEKRGRDRGSIPVWRRRESFTEEELDNQVITEESQPQSDIQLQENLPTAQSPTDVNMCNSTNSGIPTLRSLISKGGKVQKAGVVVKDNCIPGSFKFLSPPTSPSKNPDSPPRKPLDSTISVHAKIMPQSMTSESFYSDDGSPKQSPKHQVSAPMPDLLMGSPKRDPSPSKLEPIQFTIEEKSNQQSAWRKETRLWHVEGKSDPDISNISEMKSQITDEFVAPLPVTSIGMGSAKYSPVMSDSEEPPSWLSRQPDGACDPPEAVKETKSSVYNGKSSHVLRRKDLNGRPDGYASDSCCRIMKSQQFSGKALSPANSVCNCCSNREDINGNIRQQQHHQGVNHRLPPRRFEKEVEVRKASQSAKASLTSKTSKPVTNSKPDRPNVPPKPKATVKPRPHVKHDNQTRVASLADVIRIKSPPRRHNLETASLRSASSASSKSTKLPTRSSSTTAVNLLSSSSNSGSSKSNSKNSKLPLPSGKLTKNSSTTSSKSSMHSLRSATTSKSTQTNKSSQASGKSMQNQSSKSSSKSSSSGKVSSGASKIPQSSSKMSGSLSSSSKAVSKSAPSLAKSSSAKSQQGSAKTNKSTVDLNSKPSQSLKHTDSDSGNDSGIAGAESTPTKNKSRFLSPYSTVTKPRMTSRCSSGHGSDNSSTISETIGFTGSKMASPCTGGTSSGYESMLRDSEATASTSSTHDSLSESSAGRVKGVKMLKKKLSQGSRSRRTGPPRPSDSPSASRKSSPGRWVDLRPKSPNDTVALKVYEVDNIENVQRIRSDDGEKSSGTSSEDDDDEEEEEDEYYEDEDEGNDDEIDGIQCEEESMAYFNSKLAAIERKQENIATLKNRQQQLKEQLSSTKARLMIHSSEWNFNLNVLENMDPDAPNFVEALEDETVQLEKRLNVCKSHVMMVTCFDASPN